MKGIADFTRGPVTKQLICFALPLFASQLLQILYNMADMVIVGQVMGKVGLSAVAIGGDITNCLTFVAMGFLMPVKYSWPSTSVPGSARN